MEWIPKLVDTFDSGVFSLRLAWPGYHGHIVRSILKVGAIGFSVILSPIVLAICVVALATFMVSELTYRICVSAGRTGLTRIER